MLDAQIVYLNHDYNFHRVLINSSIPQLAESLLAFRHLVRETQRRNGEDAYLDGNVPSGLQQWLLKEIIRIDSSAAHADCFWRRSWRTSARTQNSKGIHEAQLLTYMKLAGIRIGLLINFNVTKLKNGIKRYVL